MNALERYMESLAVRKSHIDDGRINVSKLLSLEENHLPRVQEIVRLLHEFALFISSDSDDTNTEEADRLIDKVDLLSVGGLKEMYVESDWIDLEALNEESDS